ncbi:hypothetical protein LCGC14_3070230 [marine sediment metagenome]|uniref:Uncharacterized protein n=1 Tax=marine sediment metagenome TaxID=412755 RepID=A0A0F8WH04_9ZZZZ
MKEVQDKQLHFLEKCTINNYELVCNNCQHKVKPDDFADCLSFYEAHQNHSTFVRRLE